MNGLIIYTVGVLLVGLGCGFCWGWAEGRRKLRAELDALYRDAIAPRLTGYPLGMWDRDTVRVDLKGAVFSPIDAEALRRVKVGRPLYDQEQER